jgi:hypothetical protein
MKVARIYLKSGGEKDVRILDDNVGSWIEDVKTRGIFTADEHIPYHSIDHIWFREAYAEDEELGEVEVELENE